MNFYTPSYHGSYPAAVSPPTGNTHDHPPQRKRHYDAAMHALDQPHPPSLREILGAYRMKGEGDREMLLAILQAKTAEDQRIAAATKLHQSLLQINFAPHDDFSPGGAPQAERVERPIIHHPKINGGAPSPAVVRPPSSSAASKHHYAPAQACPPTSTSRHSHPPQERRRQSSSNGWTTAVLSPSPGAESVDEDVIYHQSPGSVKASSNIVHVHVHGTSASSSSATTDSPPGEESAEPPRGGPSPSGSGDRVMSIGTLLSSHYAAPPTNSSYERRRRRGGNGMDVDDEEEQARRGRKYDER